MWLRKAGAKERWGKVDQWVLELQYETRRE